VAFEVEGVAGIGVVAPLVRMRGLVVPDGELGDLGFEVLTGGGSGWMPVFSSMLISAVQPAPHLRLRWLVNLRRGMSDNAS
jgi:hypothetical protein